MVQLRLLPMLLALASTALGLWAALRLIGWDLSVPFSGFEELHGPLMVNGVLATLIGLERAISFRNRLALTVPALSGIASLSLFTPWGNVMSGLLWVASGAGLTVLFLAIFWLQPALHTGVMCVGAGLLAVGNIFWWATQTVPWMIFWWISFLVLLIAAERLELARVRKPTPAKRAGFATAASLFVLAPIVSLFSFPLATATAAIGLTLLGSWLLLYDIAWLNVRTEGKPRFIALCLLSGYVWLVVASGLILAGGTTLPDLFYDAFIHAIFLGFVFIMIMAHAMIILRSVIGRDVPFTRFFYLPLGLLEAGLVSRVYADAWNFPVLRMWAGLFNVVAIVLFGLMVGLGIARSSLRWLRDLTRLDFMHIQ